MKKTLYESNIGIQFNQEIHNGFCFVKVQTHKTKRAYTLKKYIFPNVELATASPFLSWENLNCCNGWDYDEDYLFTAVQDGKKLYAGCTLLLPAPGQTEEAEARLNEIKASLPENCTAGKEVVCNEHFFPFYICRKGRLADFFDLKQVLEDYKRMRVHVSPEDKETLFTLGNMELERFALEEPMCYYRLRTNGEMIVAGLLLGYPLESTASLLLGN